MKFIQLFLLSASATLIAACVTNPADPQGIEEQAAPVEVSHADLWLEKKPQIVEQLRTNARLRVQEPDNDSIYIQIRSTDSFPTDAAAPSSQLLRTLDDIVSAHYSHNTGGSHRQRP